MDDSTKAVVLEAAKLEEFVKSEGGKIVTDILKDQVTQYQDQLANENGHEECLRLAGGIRFGRELLGKLYGKIEIGKELRRREEEKVRAEKAQGSSIRRSGGEPKPNFPLFDRSAV